MRRKPLRKLSKRPQARVERQLWGLCKEIIRLRHGNRCYTCGATGLSGSNWHTGHMWPKASLGAAMKYDLGILRPQCYRCNIHLGGNGAVFYERMAKEIGRKGMETLVTKRNSSKAVTTKAYDHYIILIKKYEKILKKLELEPNPDVPFFLSI